MKPWEKYAESSGPWTKYAEPQQAAAPVTAQPDDYGGPVPQGNWYSGLERFGAGAGASLWDIGTGLEQRWHETIGRLAPEGPTREKANAKAAELRALVDEHRRLRKPLMDTGMGALGNFVGAVAPAAPLFFVPGVNTVAGATAVGAALGAIQPTGTDESVATNAATGAAFGAGGQLAAKGVGAGWRSLKSLRDARRAAVPAEQLAQDAVKRAAIDKGLRLPGDGVLEGVAGKIKTNQRLSELNQPVVNSLAKRELGLPEDAILDAATFRNLRQNAVQSGYTPIRSLGRVNADPAFKADLAALEFTAKRVERAGFSELAKKLQGSLDDVVTDLKGGSWDADSFPDVIQAYRDTAQDLLRGGTGADKRLGRAYLKAAGMLEDFSEREMQRRGMADGVQQFREARKLIAKSFDVEGSVNPGTLNVRAGKLGQALEKGRPLTGDLKLIGQAERGARGYGMSGNPLAEPTTTSPPFSPLDLWGSVMAGGAGAAGGGPWGFAAGALPLVRPLARNLVTSGPYQRAMVRPGVPGPGLLDSQGIERAMREALRVGGPIGGLYLTNE